MSYPYLYPGECPTLDDVREAMAEQRPMGADTRSGLVGWWPGRHRGSILRDFSGRANHGTWSGTGAHWAADGVRHGVVAAFDGDADLADLGTITSTHTLMLSGNRLSFCAWLYPLAGGDAWQRLVDKSDGGSCANGYGWGCAPNGVPGGIALWINGAEVGSAATGRLDLYGVGVWNHCAVTWDGSSAKFYRDGKWMETRNGANVVPVAQTNMRIGSWNHTTGREYKGRLDDLRIYTRALSAAEIKHIYECGRVAPLSDLVEPVGWETVGVSGGVVVPWHLFGRVA